MIDIMGESDIILTGWSDGVFAVDAAAGAATTSIRRPSRRSSRDGTGDSGRGQMYIIVMRIPQQLDD